MPNSPAPLAVYQPGLFEVQSLGEAMEIIVNSVPGTTAQERWEKETPYLVDDIGRHLGVGPHTCVLDYGCGIGRVAKGLIDSFGCRVVGVDFSKSMRLLAPEYVLSERFTVWSPEVCVKMIAKGFRADAAICLWVVQHVLDPHALIARLNDSLRPGGMLYTLNGKTRAVPTESGWVNDGFDMRQGLCAVFEEENVHALPENVTIPKLASTSVIQILRKLNQPCS